MTPRTVTYQTFAPARASRWHKYESPAVKLAADMLVRAWFRWTVYRATSDRPDGKPTTWERVSEHWSARAALLEVTRLRGVDATNEQPGGKP